MEAIKDHESSECYIHVMKIIQGESALEVRAVMKAVRSLKSAKMVKMVTTFKKAQAAVRKRWQFPDYF